MKKVGHCKRWSDIKMGKEVLTFDDIEAEKHRFHQHKSPISISDVNIHKLIVSHKVPFGKNGFEYFIVYKDGKLYHYA